MLNKIIVKGNTISLPAKEISRDTELHLQIIKELRIIVSAKKEIKNE